MFDHIPNKERTSHILDQLQMSTLKRDGHSQGVTFLLSMVVMAAKINMTAVFDCVSFYQIKIT